MAPTVEVRRVTATLTDGREVVTPYWAIESGTDGPVLLVVAAQHGNEVQGAEVLRRVVPEFAGALARGRALLVPFTNPLALADRKNTHGLGPEEKGTEYHQAHNMNCRWPGDPEGNDVDRLVAALDRALVQDATHAIDLHCWNKFWATATLARDDGADSARMARVAGTRFIWWRSRSEVPTAQTQIANIVRQRGGGAMVVEFSGQYTVTEREVRAGVRCVTNVARELGLLTGDPELPPNTGIPVIEDEIVTVTAPCAGLFVAAELELEDHVEVGQTLGHILCIEDLSTIEITAPVAGWLWRFGSHRPNPDVSLADQHPYSDPGDPLAAIIPD